VIFLPLPQEGGLRGMAFVDAVSFASVSFAKRAKRFDRFVHAD
jgi:hypothetical protein